MRQGFVFSLLKDNEIYLPTVSGVSLFLYYLHEFGHIIGASGSFENGFVLTPDECKDTAITLTPAQAWKIISIFASTSNPTKGNYELVAPIANECLRVFTKGNFDPEKYKVNFDVNPEEMATLSAQNDPSSTLIIKDATVVGLASTEEGVKMELPAIAVQLGCETILLNSLSKAIGQSMSFSSDGELPQSSHSIALSQVQRAYAETGIVIPSYEDMKFDPTKA